MKCVQISRFGESDVLKLEKIDRPQPKAKEVLIEVQAVGVNPIDFKTRRGHGMILAEKLPIILGWDMSGCVVAVGEGVKKYKFNDKVFGLLNFPKEGGTYAECVCRC